jgi:sugar phosphate isomerase/epimerase
MSRPVTLFTGQWADLPFETICQKARAMGYDGIEIASWGDHLDLETAAKDPKYCEEKKAILKKYDLGCWAIGTHIIGQAVADHYDQRLDAFTPSSVHGDAKKTREWAVQQMKYGAAACKNMGVDVMTGFTGSPIFRWWYSFPPTSDEMVANGFRQTVELW